MKEHDMVVFVKPHLNIPVGTKGCIVYVYQNNKAFEVETDIEGGTQLCSVEPDKLEAV